MAAYKYPSSLGMKQVAKGMGICLRSLSNYEKMEQRHWVRLRWEKYLELTGHTDESYEAQRQEASEDKSLLQPLPETITE